ncbi:MAG: LLM class flavin-dependent oxidoreductase, partial [Acidimicrobiales bacterium]
ARLGCLVFYVGFRNPALLARAAISIDHISDGRFEIGLGAGWAGLEARAHGYDFPGVGVRLDMLEEAAELIEALCTQDRTTHDGSHFTTDDVSMLPPPVRGSLPLWIGGIGERRTLRIAARRASGWNAAYASPDEFRRLGTVLDAHCEDLHRDPETIERSINLLFGMVSDERSMSTVETTMREQWGPGWPRVSSGALLGTPEMAVERILEYRDAGADMVNVALRVPIDPDAVDAYVTSVVPAVRDAAG